MQEKIFIIVKTYPNLTSLHGELVCTAGLTENGEWRRIYPVPFRSLNEREKFKKFQWINVETESAAPRDKRPESRKLSAGFPISAGETITDTTRRRGFIFSATPVYTSRSTLLKDLKTKGTSLAIFKPSEILEMTYKRTESEWAPEKLAAFQREREQFDLFSTPEEHERKFRQAAMKIPYIFRYKFKDSDGKTLHMMVEDWEIGMLYLHSAASPKCSCDGGAARMTVERYMKFAKTKDIYFFLGTSWERQQKNAPNPFLIVGVYYPPFPEPTSTKGPDETQPTLFDIK